MQDYGVLMPAVILGHKVQLLRLVHTRQQAGRGFHSSAWAQALEDGLLARAPPPSATPSPITSNRRR